MASDKLPILIAGAGPCGLVAALTLQKHGIPFRLVEKATREKLCSNVGSGFDLFPVAVNILCKRLGMEQEVMSKLQLYAGWRMMDMSGGFVREMKVADLLSGGNPDDVFLSARRAQLQNLLLDALERLDEVLLCGVQVTGYEQDEDKVTVSLSDGTTVDAAALFGCDGVHSAVRRHMFEGKDDELSFTGQLAWWAQVPITPELEAEINKTQSFRDEGRTFVWVLGTSKLPGSFMAAPAGGNFVYAFFAAADAPPTGRSSDLTRRGGVVLDESSKEELLALVAGSTALLTTAIQLTDPADITRVGLFNRANLDLPYTKGRVALLGDAAHPQSPFMGQGANMSIADAYVLSTRCAKQSIGAAIAAYDTEHRRTGVNKVVNSARTYGQQLTSSSRFTCWLMRSLMKFAPISWAMSDMLKADQSNQEFVVQLDKDLAAVAAAAAASTS